MNHLTHLIPFVLLAVLVLGVYAMRAVQRRRPAPSPRSSRPPVPGDGA